MEPEAGGGCDIDINLERSRPGGAPPVHCYCYDFACVVIAERVEPQRLKWQVLVHKTRNIV